MGRRFFGMMLGTAIAGWCVWQHFSESVQAEPLAESEHYDSGADLEVGRELFQRSWLAGDPRSPEGDGLGPMFNETSCAGCHNQGGAGGGGSADKNVELLTAFVSSPPINFTLPPNGRVPARTSRQMAATQRETILKTLKTIHPGFEKESSVVVHRFGTSPKHGQWRENLLSPAQLQVQALGSSNVRFSSVATALLPEPEPSTPFPSEDAFQAAPDNSHIGTVAETSSDSPGDLPPAAPPQINQGESLAPALPSEPQPFRGPAVQPSNRQQAPGTRVPTSLPPQPTTTFDNPVQPPPQGVVVRTATGIPLVDEALKEMRRLQNEARKDLSSSNSRGAVVLLRSQRNTSALFGAGLIDAIPDDVIEAVAKQRNDDFPRVSGRLHRLPDGKVGRFGWKAQKATLRDFTLAACANELGLDVPGHKQPDVPYADQKRKGPDMTDKQADALVAYVRSLPAPQEEKPDDKQAAKLIDEGKNLFESVGCAVCHTQNIGDVKGLYSDLLLHDMGEKLQAQGSYGSLHTPAEFDPLANDPGPQQGSGQPGPGAEDPAENDGPAQGEQTVQAKEKPAAVMPGEWRTPPLWGVRDSAPYLHDGRASTLEQAIALHGGEGSDAAIRYFMMPAKKRQRIIAFLKTLRAPDSKQTASR